MEYQEATQPTQNTQGAVDPRRIGRNNSGLAEADISDVICILHPCSPAAFRIVAATAELTPQNVLQNDGFDHFNDGLTPREEQETFILGADASDAPYQAMDLALRFSARTLNPRTGFIFGRNADMCDIVMAADTFKRVSNVHFSIFINESGVLMLRDMSTNGTLIDDVVLKGKNTKVAQTRMLNPGSIIQILSPKAEEVVKFIVRIPSREGHVEEYEAKFKAYMERVAADEGRTNKHNMLTRRLTAANPPAQNSGSIRVPLVQNQYGMHWSGGDKYNVVGLIGKGAFATVYQLATKSEGQLFAAKELEKRKFMKNGVLDRKLDNEMQIMKSVSHPNIVSYVDYQDHANHMYIIMEFVPCGDLQQYLGQRGPLSEPLARDMAGQVFDALAYLHKKRITHRDIKPDNILIANLDTENFRIKLSDFGLSKVVTDNETFLKTFCGTLLWCAPEVFPHYDAHMAGKGNKRPRQTRNLPGAKFHSYSSTVDIWSFGGVLWYSLCFKPPFEGVADGNGRGMFDKIMMTPLDATDLVKQGVSDAAVDLLTDMLNTDPASRPSPAACLQHAWFGGTQVSDDQILVDDDQGLLSIAEEDEAADSGEPDVSSLSLDEQESNDQSQASEVSIHSGSLDWLDPRQSKRFRPDANMYRNPDAMIDSSPENFYQSIPIMHRSDDRQAQTADPRPQPRKLFGEISQSALRSSGLLGHRAGDAVDAWSSSGEGQHVIDHNDDKVSGAVASPSLLGAESMVRDLNMDSPNAVHSCEARGVETAAHHSQPGHRPVITQTGLNEDGEGRPVTPEHPPEEQSNQADETPKPASKPIFDRRINIAIPASSYYVAEDPSTHNLEYASKVSGFDYVKHASLAHTATPPAASGSTTENDDDNQPTANGKQTTDLQPGPSEFVKPPPRLGRLTSTPGSFESITLNLNSRKMSWGRDPSNTHVYHNKEETLIPKIGFQIEFCARDIDQKTNDAVGDWIRSPDLHCTIIACGRYGIQVNGVFLKKSEPDRMSFGRIYTGDIITVSQKNPQNDAELKFVCEFFHGEAAKRRDKTSPPFHTEVAKSYNPKSARGSKMSGAAKTVSVA